MARTPKAAPPPPAPARRGRKPKDAEPTGFAPAAEGDTDDAEAVEAEAAIVTPVAKPARGKPGPKPKPAMATLSDADEPQPAMDLDQGEATLESILDQGDATTAEMADTVSADDGGTPVSSEAAVNNTMPAASQDGSEQAKPAARWDRVADLVQFDWPAIERTAAKEGPNQVMAKLLVAARAAGANSRWPL